MPPLVARSAKQDGRWATASGGCGEGNPGGLTPCQARAARDVPIARGGNQVGLVMNQEGEKRASRPTMSGAVCWQRSPVAPSKTESTSRGCSLLCDASGRRLVVFPQGKDIALGVCAVHEPAHSRHRHLREDDLAPKLLSLGDKLVH